MAGAVVDVVLHLPERNMARLRKGTRDYCSQGKDMQSTGKYRK